MDTFLMNPWIVAVGSGILIAAIVGVFKYLFLKKSYHTEKVAFRNQGKGARILNSEFSGFDVAIDNKGEELYTEGNKFKS